MHVHLVIISQVGNKALNITSNGALRSRVRAVVRPKITNGFMFQFTVIREDLRASEGVMLARKFEGFGHFFKC